MAENGDNTGASSGGGDDDEKKDVKELTLEQALLAPLNSILKAQLHSARSFLNLLLQLGYPPEDVELEDHKEGEPFHLTFKHYNENGQEQTLRVPALSLVPIAPLAVNSANFELEMAVNKVVDMTQLQSKRQEHIKDSGQEGADNPDKRPWFLVEKPVGIMGSIEPATLPVEGQQHHESRSAIKIKIDVKSIPMPAGLDKLLTTLTHMGNIQSPEDPNDSSGGSADGTEVDEPQGN